MLQQDIRNYITKNTGYKAFSKNHHINEEVMFKFMNGMKLSNQALRYIVDAIAVVDHKYFENWDYHLQTEV